MEGSETLSLLHETLIGVSRDGVVNPILNSEVAISLQARLSREDSRLIVQNSRLEGPEKTLGQT
jgi:hypothetical protein